MARISTLKFWFSIIAELGVVVLGLLAIVILPDVQVWLKIICCVIAVISGFALVAFGLAQRREDSIRENNEGFRDRLLNRMHDRMFSSETAVVSTKEKNQLQLEVNEADPRVYVEVLDQRETLYAKTVFLLHNREQDVAHRVQIQPLKLNCGTLSPV